MLPPRGTALGLLAPWATTLGFLPPCPSAAGIWSHRAVAAVGYGDKCIFLQKFGSTIYFSKKSRENKYKKISPSWIEELPF
jgi:hypothetical protein